MPKNRKKSNTGITPSINLLTDTKGALLHVSDHAEHSIKNNGKEKELLDCFYKTIPQPLLVYDPSTLCIIYTNPAFQQLYGYSKKEALQITIADLQTQKEKKITSKQLCKKIQGSTKPIIATHLTKNNLAIKVEMIGSTVKAGTKEYHLIYVKDVTQVVKEEESIKISREVGEAIEKGSNYKDSLEKALLRIRKFTGFELGEIWLFSQENNFGLIEAFSVAKGRSALKHFVTESLSLRITKQQINSSSLYGPMKSIWINSLREQPAMMRSAKAIKAGLETAIIIPILERGQLIGGLFLFSEKIRKHDQALLDILIAASNRIGEEIRHRRTYDQLQSFFQLSGDLLCITDMNGYFKKINPSVCKLLGFSEEEMLEQKVITFVHEEDRDLTEESVVRLLKNNELKHFSNRFRCSNGEYKWLSWSATYAEDHQLIIAVARDITNDRASQEELIYKDKLLSVIADAANSLIKEDNYRTIIPGIIQKLGKVTSSDSVYVFENSKNKKGESVSSITYEWCSPDRKPQIDNPELKEIPFKFFADQLEGLKEGAVYSKTTDRVNNEGVQKLLESLEIKSILIVPLFVGQEFWGFVGFDDCRQPRIWSEMDKGVLKTFASSLASAIERNRTEAVILESEARFRHMSDHAPVMIWVSDENDNTIYTNKNWLDFTGITVSEVNKNSWASLVHPDDMKIAITDYDAQFKKRIPALLEYRLRTKSGDYRWVIDQATPRFLANGKFLGYIGSVIDIHDRKLSEEKLSYQAHVLQEVTEAIISTDLDFTVITWNKGAEKIYGINAADIIGKSFPGIISHSYLIETREEALEHLYTYDYWSGEVYFDRADGRQMFLHSSVSFVTNKNGVRIGLAGVHRDITDKRKSEMALRISEERYRSVVDALGEGIVLQDQSGRIVTTNASAEKILGLTADQLHGVGSINMSTSTIHEDGTPFPGEQHPGMITQQTGKSLQNIIMGVNKPDGTLTWISINTEPLYYSDQRVSPDAVVVSFIDITQKKTAEIELQRNEQQLHEYSDRINSILDSITDGFIAVDNEMNVFLWNKVFEINTGIRTIEAMGKKVTDVFPDLMGSIYDQFLIALDENRTIVQEYNSTKYNMWFETTAYPSSQGLFIYFRDISKRKRQESLLALEKEVLELNAKPQASLKSTTDFLLEGLEKIFPGIRCSVLSLQEDGVTIETLSAPNIPKAYSDDINGKKIGPNMGSCGTAMYLKQNIIIEDIATHKLSECYKDIALQYDMRACWSFPILSSQNKVLASFAVYHTKIKEPTSEELLVFERAINILRIIIENKQSEEKIKVSNERYLLATMATNDAIWDWDVATNNMYWGEGFHGLFGYKAGYFSNDLGMWENGIHPLDKVRVIESIQNFVESSSQRVWQEEYRFKKADGKYVLVADRGFLIYNQQGRVNRMVGSMQDITEKREMERKLLTQELNRQKLIAQAVVEAQEKERSLIGKELHDNINQILSTAKLYLEVARTDDKERTNLIDMSTKGISDAINEIRTISRSLVPSSIGDLGLVESIQDLVESIKLTRKLNVEFYYHNGIDDLITEQQKLMLFRITQEQVNNVIKHANASNLVIELISEDDTINIAITDNGQGFDPDQVKFKKGVGLSNITSRAELFNGKVTIDSAPGKGCTLNIHVPISNI